LCRHVASQQCVAHDVPAHELLPISATWPWLRGCLVITRSCSWARASSLREQSRSAVTALGRRLNLSVRAAGSTPCPLPRALACQPASASRREGAAASRAASLGLGDRSVSRSHRAESSRAPSGPGSRRSVACWGEDARAAVVPRVPGLARTRNAPRVQGNHKGCDSYSNGNANDAKAAATARL